jgi:NADH-quinone oxidoreductase subunit F
LSLVIKVGLASCGLAAGAGEVYDAILKHIKKNKIDAEVKKTACIGMCFVEPLVEIYEDKKKSITYGDVTSESVGNIIDSFSKGKPIEENVIISNILKGSENKTFNKQKRIVLRNCGIIDPVSIDDYLENDGYKALEKSVKDMSREAIIDEIKIQVFVDVEEQVFQQVLNGNLLLTLIIKRNILFVMLTKETLVRLWTEAF